MLIFNISVDTGAGSGTIPGARDMFKQICYVEVEGGGGGRGGEDSSMVDGSGIEHCLCGFSGGRGVRRELVAAKMPLCYATSNRVLGHSTGAGDRA